MGLAQIKACMLHLVGILFYFLYNLDAYLLKLPTVLYQIIDALKFASEGW